MVDLLQSKGCEEPQFMGRVFFRKLLLHYRLPFSPEAYKTLLGLQMISYNYPFEFYHHQLILYTDSVLRGKGVENYFKTVNVRFVTADLGIICLGEHLKIHRFKTVSVCHGYEKLTVSSDLKDAILAIKILAFKIDLLEEGGLSDYKVFLGQESQLLIADLSFFYLLDLIVSQALPRVEFTLECKSTDFNDFRAVVTYIETNDTYENTYLNEVLSNA